MEASEFLEPFERMLESAFPAEIVRAIDQGGDWQAAWGEFDGSGFADALVSEDCGGAGLALQEALPLWLALGRHAVPLPIAETMVVRALVASSDADCPDGPAKLSDLEENSETHPTCGLDGIAALIHAALMAGAAGRILEMTVGYANERVQFGKPIGRQQAVQQQLALMAEEVVAMRLAAETAAASGDPWPAREAAACAKAYASAAAPRITGIAHAVHGAIGISQEYDLQLFTRFLHAHRLTGGSEMVWNRDLGAGLLASDESVLDFLRARVFG